MSKIKIKTKEEVLEIVKRMVEEHEYDASRTKNPRKKRQLENSVSFWRSLQFHLVKETAL